MPGLADNVQVLCTNDFSGAWDPERTHNGLIPGAKGLRKTVARLRERSPSIWVDAGDLATGGALATVDDGWTAWQAADSLGIDIAVPGNHEFDWGADRFSDLARRSRMNYLCANAKLGLPPTHIVDSAAGPIGFIGLTYPDLAAISPELACLDQPPLAETVADTATALRRDGVEFVIAIVHDGVDRPGTPSFLGDWYARVDAVIAGHTLWRHIGVHSGVAICQPAPYGVEVGVLELRYRNPIQTYGVTVTSEGPWDGVGATYLHQARHDVLALCRRERVSALGRPNDLLDELARNLAQLSGSDAAIVSLWDCFVTQPVNDGVLTYVPAGPFTRADLMRYSPHADEPVKTLDLTAAEFVAAQGISEIPFLSTIGIASPDGVGRETIRVAASNRQAASYSAALGQRARPVMRNGKSLTLRDVWSTTVEAA